MDTENLISYIHRIMTSSGSIRKDLETQLLNLAKTDPTSYLQSSLFLLHNPQSIHSDLRLYGILHLKQMLTEPSFQNCLNISNFLQDLSILLKNEPNTQILSFLSEIYGENAGNLLKGLDLAQEPQAKLTNDLLNNDVWELLTMPNENRVVAGLNILIKLVEIALEELLIVFQENLYSIINKMLSFYDPKILKAVVKLLTRVLSYAEYSLCKKYIPLMPQMIEILFQFLNQKSIDGEQILADFYEIAEAEPKVFIQSFPSLLSKTLDLHSDTSISAGVKQQALELLLSIIERIPKALFLSQQALENLFQMIFLHLMSVKSFESDENFSEEKDSEFESVRFGREALDRIMSALGGTPLLELFSVYIQRLLQMNDWRFTFSALMGLSQVGEYLDEISDIEASIQLTLGFISHNHPMIRYAVCHTLGQLSADMKPEFQLKYHDRILPLLIDILYDKSPLVASHGAAALSNFIEGMNLKPLQEYLNNLIPRLLECIEKSNGVLKEQSIFALGNTGKIARDTFRPYQKPALNLLFVIIKEFYQEKFKKLRGVALGAICLIGTAVGSSYFGEYIEELMKFLSVMPGVLFEINDLIIAWKRVLGFLDYELLLQYMNEQAFECILGMSRLCQENNEDFESSLKLLNLFLEKINLCLKPYFERISGILIPLSGFDFPNTVRIICLKGLPLLVKMLEKGPQADLFIKGLLDLILKMNEERMDLDVRNQMVRALIGILEQKSESFSFIKEDFEQLISLVWQNIENSIGNKQRYEKKRIEDEDMDEDEAQLLEDDIKAEIEFLENMGELLAFIFKRFQYFVPEFRVIDIFFMNFAQKALDSGLQNFILYTIDDMMDEKSLMELLIPHKNTILHILLNNLSEKNCEVRQASLYGIGIFVEKFKGIDLEMGLIENIRIKIIETLKIKKDKESNKAYGLCKDNAVSALGKLFRAYHDQINLKQTVQIWLEGLPIKYDVKEAFVQYEILFGVLVSDPNVVIMDSSDNLERVFKIIGEIYGTHLINEGIREMILKFVKNIANLKNYDFDKFGLRFKEMNPSALKRMEQCFQDVKQL